MNQTKWKSKWFHKI